MPSAEQRPMRMRLGTRVALYAALTFGILVVDRSLFDPARPTALGWWLAKVALPLAATAVVGIVASRYGNVTQVLALRRPPRRHLGLAALAGLPAVGVLVAHAILQGAGPLWGSEAAKLVVRIALNQGWLEELLARGLLLGGLLGLGVAKGRACWLSATCFAVMHMEQFLLPPVSAAGLANGVVLVVLTLPLGLAAARLVAASDSLWPAVLLHFLVDLTILPQKLQHPMTLAILVAALLGAAIVLIALAREKPAPAVEVA